MAYRQSIFQRRQNLQRGPQNLQQGRQNSSDREQSGDGHLQVGTATSLGRVRVNNEDAWLAGESVFAVADGMGGHEAGEIAAHLAIDTLKHSHLDLTVPENLESVVRQANEVVLNSPRQGIGRVGMGTTLTAAVIDYDRLVIAQVGDSRAYLLHNDSLRRLTRDHSLVQELVYIGEITEEETHTHPRRGVITRVLGFDTEVQPDLYEVRLAPGDRLLLCSDGLHGMLDDAQIEAIVKRPMTAQQCADNLVRAANAAGGQDNITVVVIDVTELTAARRSAWSRLDASMRVGLIGFLIALTVLVGATVGGVWLYARNSAYLIAEDGQVVVYRGLLGEVFGFTLQWRYADTDIDVDKLKSPLPERLEQGIQLSNMTEAEHLVEQYRQDIEGN